MNSDDIFDAIEKIAATSSKTAKQEQIKRWADVDLDTLDGDFVRVLKAALDPFVTYGIAKRPAKLASHCDGVCFDDDTWLLLDGLAQRKLTGNAAIEALKVEMLTLSPKSSELLWRIVSKDLRAGFSESTVNKAIPGTIVTFDCMLAHKFQPERIKAWPVVAEPKLDGVRVLCTVVDRSVKFFSRSGKEFTTFEHLKEPILEAATQAGWRSENFVLDGEVVSGSFNKTVSEVRKKDVQATDAEFHAFDLISLNTLSEGESKRPYTERRALLEGFVNKAVKGGPIKIVPRYLVSSVSEIDALYESVRARGLEGLIIKTPDANYVTKRSHAWLKIKNEESVDVRIVGYEEGTGKYAGMLGALIVDHAGVRVNVGTGFSDSQRESFWADRQLLIGRLCEVEYHEITPDGSLRHPRFRRFRDSLAHGVKE